MKTTNTHKAFLESLIKNQDFYDYNAFQISTLERLKLKEPFSHRLNDFTSSWFKKHESIFVFSSDDDFDPSDTKGTLNRYLDRYKKTNTIVVNTNNLENSIYGGGEDNKKVALYARCIHEYLHLTLELPYNPLGETLAGIYHAGLLPFSFERQLIIADIVGQLLYYYKHRSYVIDQRIFCIAFLKNPYEAVYTLQQKN